MMMSLSNQHNTLGLVICSVTRPQSPGKLLVIYTTPIDTCVPTIAIVGEPGYCSFFAILDLDVGFITSDSDMDPD